MSYGKHEQNRFYDEFGPGSIRTPKPVKQDHRDSLTFLNIMDKLMADIRRLNATIAKETEKTEEDFISKSF